MRLLLLSILLLTILGSCERLCECEKVTITGTVYDGSDPSDPSGIGGVTVRVSWMHNPTSTRTELATAVTNEKGEFRIPVKLKDEIRNNPVNDLQVVALIPPTYVHFDASEYLMMDPINRSPNKYHDLKIPLLPAGRLRVVLDGSGAAPVEYLSLSHAYGSADFTLHPGGLVPPLPAYVDLTTAANRMVQVHLTAGYPDQTQAHIRDSVYVQPGVQNTITLKY
ncbi:MAG TPA: carboxypeptidase-like regulatory domain-containing protein [Chitinophagaceae bacterium]|nr:carboxypeptidase-like regulatory domain-containing protein [Chitinophagaceae bacterium]